MSQTKTITTYKVSAFDSKAAAEGGLCVMVASTYDPSQNGGVIDTTANSNTIKGTGICKCVNPDKFLFTVDSIVYTFNSEGKAANLNSVGMKLLMGEVTETLATAGARVTRGTSSYDITSLSARDEFAIQALRGLLRTIEDPASLSDTEKRYYCDVAYQWAANMMQSAAYTRQNAVNPADVSVPDVEGIVGALETVRTAINNINISGGSSGGSTDVSGIVNKLEDIDFADGASLDIAGGISVYNPVVVTNGRQHKTSLIVQTDSANSLGADSTIPMHNVLKNDVDDNDNVIPLYVSMPGYLPIGGNAKSASGLKSNHDDALLFVTPPEYQDFNGSQGSQYSWYTGTGGEDYFKAVLRWLCQEYGEEYNNKIVTFIMKCRPNGRATSILLIYNPGDIDDTTKLPRWSGGTVFTIGGNPSIFSYGTSNYAYFFNQGNVAYASTAGSVSDYSVTSNKLASSSVTKDKLHYNIADDYVTIRTVQTITGNKSLKGNLTFYNDDDKSAEITYQGDAEFNTVTAKNVITSNIIYGSTFSVLDSNYDAITNAVILSKSPGDQTSSTKPLSDFVMSLSMESLCRALLNANISYYFNSILNQYAFSNPIAMTSSNINNNDYFYYKGTYTDSNNVNWVNPIFRYYAATVLLIIDGSGNYYSYDLPITTRSFPNTSSNAASGLVNAVRAILGGLNVGLMPSQQTYTYTLSSRGMIEVKLFIQ